MPYIELQCTRVPAGASPNGEELTEGDVVEASGRWLKQRRPDAYRTIPVDEYERRVEREVPGGAPVAGPLNREDLQALDYHDELLPLASYLDERIEPSPEGQKSGELVEYIWGALEEIGG